METIELNGKKYIAFEDYEKEKKEVKELIPKIHLDCYCPDEANVLGIGTLELIQGDWHKVCLSTSELKKIVKGLEAFAIAKEGITSLHLVWAKNSPCIIGKVQKTKENKYYASGFILAPRREED